MTSTTSISARLADTFGDRSATYRTVIALFDTIELEIAGHYLWRVCNRHVGSGQNRFMAFIDEKYTELIVSQFTDRFERRTFSTTWDALVPVLPQVISDAS